MNKDLLKKREKVAEIIQTARVLQDITQEELAEKVGFSRSTIHRIEKGVFSPNADQLYAILAALNLKLEIDGKEV
jgi:transcriptional regulator with XRE-family HTH domain